MRATEEELRFTKARLEKKISRIYKEERLLERINLALEKIEKKKTKKQRAK